MIINFQGIEIPVMFLVFLIIVIIWEAVWKLVGLWKSAQNNQIAWFIFIAIFNTAGLLPILYVFFFQKKGKVGKSKKK